MTLLSGFWQLLTVQEGLHFFANSGESGVDCKIKLLYMPHQRKVNSRRV